MIAVRVNRAQIEKRNDILTKGDPYVVIRNSQGEIRTKTAPLTDGIATFNEVFPFNTANDANIHVSVWDEDTFTKDDCLGETTVNVKGALASNMTATWHPIYWKGKQTGQVYIELQGNGPNYQPWTQNVYVPQPGFNPIGQFAPNPTAQPMWGGASYPPRPGNFN